VTQTRVYWIPCRLGQEESLKQRDKAANDLFSNAVSKIRQPIESLLVNTAEPYSMATGQKVLISVSGIILLLNLPEKPRGLLDLDALFKQLPK
jgi:hypothetical protein